MSDSTRHADGKGNASRPARLTQKSPHFEPRIVNLPDLPAIDFVSVGGEPPRQLDTPDNWLPNADVVVITWAVAEWAALEQVFVSSEQQMPYANRSTSRWPGWYRYERHLQPSDDWSFWGWTRLVEVNGQTVLLLKSNTHLDWPGRPQLEELVRLLIEYVRPGLILSIGTAGGSREQDRLGTVNVVNAGTYYSDDKPRADWPTYRSQWRAEWSVVENSAFKDLLFAVPVTNADLESLAMQYRDFYKVDYSLHTLNADDLNCPDPSPLLHNLTNTQTSLLTASNFLVGTTSWCYADYACIEMDDAVIGDVCNRRGVEFGFVRNISDPAQNEQLPDSDQQNWGGAIYDVYGLYTSFNGALVTWAALWARGA